jgi:16S rRNA (guanine527-N7)-methyltransferase
MSGVKRETVEDVLDRYGVGAEATEPILRLLAALAADPDAPTAVRDPRRALDLHIADSLSALELAEVRAATAICDLGSGAGFPGLALALALPEATVDLVEASSRKAATIARLAAEAPAPRTRAVARRAEDWAREEGSAAYDVVCARAVGPLATLCEYAAPLLRADGALVAWKGRRDPDEERQGADAADQLGLQPDRVVAVAPFPAAHSRHLHVLVKVAPTPPRFPRRPGLARKRPLGRG